MSDRTWKLLAIVAVLMALAGCGGGGSGGGAGNAGIVGVWEVRTIQLNNLPVVACGAPQNGTQAIGCDAGQTATFYPDGTLQTFNGRERGQGTWRLNGSQLTLSAGQNDPGAPPVTLAISQSGDQLTVDFVDTAGGTPVRYRSGLQRVSTQPPALVPTSSPPILSWRAGGGDAGTGGPTPPRSLADYVGTWNGTFTTAGTGFSSALQAGTVTLTFDGAGHITGQVINATTRLTSPVTGTLTADAGLTAGFNDATYPLTVGVKGFFLGPLTIAADGRMQVGLSLQPLPQDPASFGNVVAMALLTRQ